MDLLTLTCAILLCSINTINGQKRIWNGENAKPGQFPYHAIASGAYMCGASIIDKRWLLTAAHCSRAFEGAAVEVGTVNKHGVGGTKYAIKRFIKHEEFRVDRQHHDIALVQVETDIVYHDSVKPVELPTDDTDKYVNKSLIATGFGYINETSLPRTLRYVILRVMEESECKSVWPNITEKHICTSVENKQSVCKGDSGGALVFNNTVVGISSFGPAGTKCNYEPSVFTRVSSYLSWINDKIKYYSRLS